MNALVGLEQIRRKLLKQYTVADIMAMDECLELSEDVKTWYTVADIMAMDEWFLEQSLDTAWNRAKLMDSLERLDRCKERLFEAALKGGE
nr:MAG TPA: hypothetical protein [Caudoviricetes sp.]